MLPIIGLIIAAYTSTRLLSFLIGNNQTKEHIVVRVVSGFMLALTIFFALALIAPGPAVDPIGLDSSF